MFYTGKVSYIEEKLHEKVEIFIEAVSFTDAEAKLTEALKGKHQLAIRAIKRKIVDEININTSDGIYVDVQTLAEDPETNRLIVVKHLVEVESSIKEVFDILEIDEADFIKINQTKIDRVII